MYRTFAAFGLATLLGSTALAGEVPGSLVGADWLESRLGQDGLVVLDVRSSLSDATPEDFVKGHIPGAVYSNYAEDGWRVERDGVIGMAPGKDDLERLIGGLGISNDDTVVVVHGGKDSTDFGGAARVYWTLKYAGHDDVVILDGGWRAWTSDPGRPVATGTVDPQPETYTAELRPELRLTTEEVEAGLADPDTVRVDARPLAQYEGREKHDAARAPGRLPDALGLDQGLFVDPATGKLKSRNEILALLPDELKARRDDRIVSYCNTGHWAATDWFVLSEVAGFSNVTLYDGSMVGWTFDPSRPIETGKSALQALGRWVDEALGS